MKVVHIKQKLQELDVELENLVLGDFDTIGELTAKKRRERSDPLYARCGAYFRPQYERGILIYSLIRRFKMTSLLEIGTGRGYSVLCAAKAFHDMGVKGRIVTIDPQHDKQFFNQLRQAYPREWFDMIEFKTGTSRQICPELTGTFDLVYIDGAHDYESVKQDIEMTVPQCTKIMLMDDYHLSSKDDPGIQCAKAIDEFSWVENGFNEPELTISDRRIFFDDRRIPDELIDYGQILCIRKDVINNEW